MGDGVKSLPEVQVDNVHCSPHICQASHFVTEGGQVGQAKLPLGEAVLSPPSDFLVVHMPGNGSQDQLLHHLPRNGDEADWTLVPWVLLCVLPEDRSEICSPVLSQLPLSITDY